MKKVVRTVWISLLTGLAFLVACTTPKGLTRAEKKQLKAERAELVAQIDRQVAIEAGDPRAALELREEELQLRERLVAIDLRLGDQESLNRNNMEITELQQTVDSLRRVIDDLENNVIEPCVYGPPPVDNPVFLNEKEQQRHELMDRLEVLQNTIRRREGACVYGSPEVLQKYKEETNRLRQEAKDIEKQLEELDKDE